MAVQDLVPISEVSVRMNTSIWFIIITLFLGTFFLVPDRTALKTALRYRIPSRDILLRFSKFSPRRIVLAVSGSIISTVFGILGLPIEFFVSSMLALASLYILDFFTIENIAKEIDLNK